MIVCFFRKLTNSECVELLSQKTFSFPPKSLIFPYHFLCISLQQTYPKQKYEFGRVSCWTWRTICGVLKNLCTYNGGKRLDCTLFTSLFLFMFPAIYLNSMTIPSHPFLEGKKATSQCSFPLKAIIFPISQTRYQFELVLGTHWYDPTDISAFISLADTYRQISIYSPITYSNISLFFLNYPLQFFLSYTLQC